MRPVRFHNTLLRALGVEAVKRLALRPMTFEVGFEMEHPGRIIPHLFFLEEGMASMTATFSDGSQVEVGMFGYESVVGISALLGSRRSLNRVYAQIAGRGYRCPVEAARREFRLGNQFQFLALRYVQAQLVQVAQAAGCNATHNLDQRLARWLLMCSDRVHGNAFRMSHEYLADTLGVTRPTVSLAAKPLKQAGVIEYHQGTIRILDSRRLEARACECYLDIKNHLSNYAELDTANTAQPVLRSNS